MLSDEVEFEKLGIGNSYVEWKALLDRVEEVAKNPYRKQLCRVESGSRLGNGSLDLAYQR